LEKNPSPGTQGYKSEKGLYLTIEGYTIKKHQRVSAHWPSSGCW